MLVGFVGVAVGFLFALAGGAARRLAAADDAAVAFAYASAETAEDVGVLIAPSPDPRKVVRMDGGWMVTEVAYPLYSESSPQMDLPQGWQSQTPSEPHLQIALSMSSESIRISGPSWGLTSVPRGAVTQASQRRRCRSRMTMGAGALAAQFYGTVSGG